MRWMLFPLRKIMSADFTRLFFGIEGPLRDAVQART
jgi:hypothetical protein